MSIEVQSQEVWTLMGMLYLKSRATSRRENIIRGFLSITRQACAIYRIAPEAEPFLINAIESEPLMRELRKIATIENPELAVTFISECGSLGPMVQVSGVMFRDGRYHNWKINIWTFGMSVEGRWH